MALTALVLSALTVVIVSSGLFGLAKALRANNELLAVDRYRPDTTDELARVSRAVTANYDEIQNLRLAVDEGIRSVTRAEKRVAKTVQGARRKLAESGLEHPGLEAEAAELRNVDGEGSEEDELPTVQPDMEEDLFIDTGIPGYDGRS